MNENNGYEVHTWTGENKFAKKIAFLIEKDQYGSIFYKIEGQNSSQVFMINYFYDEETAIKVFIELVSKFSKYQTEQLKE